MLLALIVAAALQQTPEFGSQGQVMPLGGISITNVNRGDTSETAVAVDPEILFFVANHVLAGIDAAYTSISGSNESAWGIGLHAGGSVNLGPAASVLFVGTIGFTSGSSTFNLGGSSITDTRHAFVVGAAVPLLFHVAPHFFVGFGPSALWEVAGGVSSTSGGSGDITKGRTLALQTLIGGWF